MAACQRIRTVRSAAAIFLSKLRPPFPRNFRKIVGKIVRTDALTSALTYLRRLDRNRCNSDVGRSIVRSIAIAPTFFSSATSRSELQRTETHGCPFVDRGHRRGKQGKSGKNGDFRHGPSDRGAEGTRTATTHAHARTQAQTRAHTYTEEREKRISLATRSGKSETISRAVKRTRKRPTGRRTRTD